MLLDLNDENIVKMDADVKGGVRSMIMIVNQTPLTYTVRLGIVFLFRNSTTGKMKMKNLFSILSRSTKEKTIPCVRLSFFSSYFLFMFFPLSSFSFLSLFLFLS